MRQPLSVSTPNITSHDAPVHVAEVDIETGIPLPLSIHVITRHVWDIFHGGAKASRAHHRTVGA